MNYNKKKLLKRFCEIFRLRIFIEEKLNKIGLKSNHLEQDFLIRDRNIL